MTGPFNSILLSVAVILFVLNVCQALSKLNSNYPAGAIVFDSEKKVPPLKLREDKRHWFDNKFSIVLVDFNEPLLTPTIHSILVNSSKELLGEILIIDDGSAIPISYDHPLVRIVRSENRTGLIQARNRGGNEAKGDYIAIMDAHIKVAEGWLDQPFQLMKENYRTVVNPVVFSLNATDFEFQKGMAGVGSSAGLYWSFKHKWGSGKRDGSLEAAGTMGEFFISKQWWTEIEGMDEGMNQWGGENIDISLRTWLCGGRIVVAPTCYIAHAFRTKFPYQVDGSAVLRNAARSAEVWLGEEYIDIFYKERQIQRGSIDIGDISKPLLLKEKLKCHKFSWYVDYFKGISPCYESDPHCGSQSTVEISDIDPKFK